MTLWAPENTYLGPTLLRSMVLASMDNQGHTFWWFPDDPKIIKMGPTYNGLQNKILTFQGSGTPNTPNPFIGTWQGDIGSITFNSDWTFTTTIDWLHIIW